MARANVSHRRPNASGANNRRWRGGRYVTREGYVMILVGIGAPMADCRGYAYEHRIVMSKMLGRPLRPDELVHHKDENRQNNATSNLEVVTRFEHKVLHRELDLGRRLPGESNPVIECRCGCGTTFEKFDAFGRPRKVVTGHGRTGLHPRRDAVLMIVQAGVLHQVEIAKRLGRSLSTVRAALAALLDAGLVVKSGRGTWAPKE